MRNDFEELIKGKYYSFKDGLTLQIAYECVVDYMHGHPRVNAASLLLYWG